MALSDQLSELAKRAKEIEDRTRAATTEAKEEVQTRVKQASETVHRQADELTTKTEASKAQASAWWVELKSDWATRMAKVREGIAAREAAADAREAQLDADIAEADAEVAINIASEALDEAEYAVMDAILAQKEADEAGVSA
jgi:hypothetical protein